MIVKKPTILFICIFRRDHIIQRPIGFSDFKRRGSVGLIIMLDLLLKIDKGQSVILICNV